MENSLRNSETLEPYTSVKQEPEDEALISNNRIEMENYGPELLTDRDEPEYINLTAIPNSENSSAPRSNLCLNPLASANKVSPSNNVEAQDSNEYFSEEGPEPFLLDQCDGNNCRVCKQAFSDTSELMAHFKSRRLGDRKYKCCNCTKTFRDNTQLQVHVRKHTGEQPFECKVCAKKFSVNGNLNKHMRIHTGERRFECDVCERKFTQFAHLEDHQRTHSGERPFVCDYCQAGFKTKARLKKHRKSHEEDKVTKRSVKCPHCWKMLRNTKQLTVHLASHSDEDIPFHCMFCGKIFDKYADLQVHQKTHSGIRGYQCHYCDRTFASASHLRRHLNSHTGLRPFTCEVCNRGFPSQQNMKRHMMTHTGEKPYTCDVCQRSFLTLENLNRHKRTHTGEKPFSCETCGRKFAHSTTAKEHQRVHTGEKPFSCTLCDKSFALSKVLFKHVREKHPKYFPEFQKLNSLPLNMKRALNKLKKQKNEIKTENDNGSILEKISILGTVKSEPADENVDVQGSTEVKIEKTEEPVDEGDVEKSFINQQTNSDSDNKCNISVNNSSVEVPLVNNLDIPFVKVENYEYSENEGS